MKIQRSMLSVPASSGKMMAKVPSLGADLILLDLEDGVAVPEKERARAEMIRAVEEIDWGRRRPAYRINGLDTPWFYRDLIDVVEAVGERIELIVIPKVGSAAEVQAVDILLTGIERARGQLVGTIGLEAIIESASGLSRVEEIARSSPRLRGLIFGPGDFSASMRMPGSGIGIEDRWDEGYPGHRFHYPMERIVLAARTAGILAIDGPVATFREPESFLHSARIARSLGYDGKWCIHPSQVSPANDIFSPTADEVTWAQRILASHAEAERSGLGAVTVDGAMIDAATVRMAHSVLARDHQAEGSS